MLAAGALGKTIEAIEAAFADVTYPGDANITYDQGGSHLECSQIASRLRGKGWRDLDLRFLIHERQSIFFMTPEAHAYYLPAYLIQGLVNYEQGGVNAADAALHSLDPAARSREEFETLIAPLTLTQRQAVAMFLRYLGEQHGHEYPDKAPSKVLRAYWERFLPGGAHT